MRYPSRQAGQNIRELARKRRGKAVMSFAAAGVALLVPFALHKAFGDFATQFTDNSNFQGKIRLPVIVLLLHIAFIVAALSLASNGKHLWRRANNADQGAKGEESVSQELVQLDREGWSFEYGMQLGNRLGDADIIGVSPRNKVFVIDVKSHRGEVTTDGKILLRRRKGKTTYPFEKDFIRQVMKQALQIREQKNFDFVTPVIAFSDAEVRVPHEKLRNVYVVEKNGLVRLLKALG